MGASFFDLFLSKTLNTLGSLLGDINSVRLDNYYCCTIHWFYSHGYWFNPVLVHCLHDLPTNYGGYGDFRPYLAMLSSSK